METILNSRASHLSHADCAQPPQPLVWEGNGALERAEGAAHIATGALGQSCRL